MEKAPNRSKKSNTPPARSKQEKMKRIEYKGKHIRASRTGGVAARATVSDKKLGIGATVNTKHGLQLHKRFWNGARVGFQKGRFQFIGRYGKGPFIINQSKKGFSASYSNSFGSYNFFKPQYSSFRMGGLHFRGQTAQMLQAVIMLFVGTFNLILFSLRAIYVLAWVVYQIVVFFVKFAWASFQFLKELVLGFIQGFKETPK